MLATRLVPARLLASVPGQIIYNMSLAMGPVACLRTRALYEVVNKRFMSGKFQLSHDEVLFWHSSLPSLNGRPIWFSRQVARSSICSL